MSNYKNTLNLPNTKFSMRANLAIKELGILKKWSDMNLYITIRKKMQYQKTFILQDGPPYANGNIHIGHALNKTLKSIIINFKSLTGYDANFVPGWDCHGLPIEQQVEKLTLQNRQASKKNDFIKQCRQYANRQVAIQKQDFVRLGVIGSWQKPYLTMQPQIEAKIIKTFKSLLDKGYIYQGKKPVHWCFNCQSTIAEAEIEYKNIDSQAAYISFEIVDKGKIQNILGKFLINSRIFIVIWTTQPWTIIANQAVAINPDYTYQFVKIKSVCFIIEKSLTATVLKKLKVDDWQIVGYIQGCELQNTQLRHPILNKFVSVLTSQHVTKDFGTGAVHIAPAHGLEDYVIAEEYKLDVLNAVDAQGFYNSEKIKCLRREKIFSENNVITKILDQRGSLIYTERFHHSYPHCWRHNEPVVFRTTSQWFINMEKNNLREKLLKSLKRIEWKPTWGERQIKDMILKRPDWCISRQRSWGVPIPFLMNKKTQALHPCISKIIARIASVIKKQGIEAWKEVEKSAIIKDSQCYDKSADVLDVWFDSGCVHRIFQGKKNKAEHKVADMYLEGQDQYRGWFMSSLIISVALTGYPSCSKILTHSFVVDKDGSKMSKSTGKAVSPQQIIKTLGADVLRLWIAQNEYFTDMSISKENLQSSTNIYRKIRNTIRFALSNLYDFLPSDKMDIKRLLLIDQWAVYRLYQVQKQVKLYYENYQFHRVVQAIVQFCSIDMGSFYFDIIKDRQYTNSSIGLPRRSSQTALWYIVKTLTLWIAPILPFTAEESWLLIPKKKQINSIFLHQWFDCNFAKDLNVDENLWKILGLLKEEVNKIIEILKKQNILKSSLEAKIEIFLNRELKNKITHLSKELRFLFISSSVTINEYQDFVLGAHTCTLLKEVKIRIQKIEGQRCPRCWNYERSINLVCTRCRINMNTNEGEKRLYI